MSRQTLFKGRPVGHVPFEPVGLDGLPSLSISDTPRRPGQMSEKMERRETSLISYVKGSVFVAPEVSYFLGRSSR